MEKIDLYIFAHRAEAGAFEQYFKTRPVPGFAGLYQDDDRCRLILVCGEGLHRAMIKTTEVLSQYKEKIGRVYNYGVAACLDGRISLGSIVELSHCFAYRGAENFEYHSFELLTGQKENAVYGLSAYERILVKETSSYLSKFASVLDREVWSVCYVAGIFGFKVYAGKLIVDLADEQTDCDQIRQFAQKSSEKLLAWHLTHHENVSKSKTLPDQNRPIMDKLHLTQSSRSQFGKLKRQLIAQGMSESEFNLSLNKWYEGLDEASHPKKKTLALLDKMHSFANPQLKKIQDRLHNVCDVFKAHGMTYQFDPRLDHPYVKISAEISSAQDMSRLQGALKKFDVAAWQDIFSGVSDAH